MNGLVYTVFVSSLTLAMKLLALKWKTPYAVSTCLAYRKAQHLLQIDLSSTHRHCSSRKLEETVLWLEGLAMIVLGACLVCQCC